MSPTYPTQNKADLRALLTRIRDLLDPEVVFHEPINPRGSAFEDCRQVAAPAGADDLGVIISLDFPLSVLLKGGHRHGQTVRIVDPVAVDTVPDAAEDTSVDRCPLQRR